MSLECKECKRSFTVKSNLTRHLRIVHNVEVERNDILPGNFDSYHYKCLEGCNISFKYNRELRTHLKSKHNINIVSLDLEFPNSEEFDKWLQKEESNGYVQYVHLTAIKRKTTGTETYYYECSRTGKRNYVDDSVRKRRPRKYQKKVNHGCTSQIIVNKYHDGSHSITYYKTHYGHDFDVEQTQLSRQERGAIASKLLLGVPISTVLHSVQNSSGNLKRINFIGRKDITNIQRSFNIGVKDGKSDCGDVNLFIEECSKLPYNPILFCNVNEFPENENIYFVLMTEYQSEILKNATDNYLIINSVHLKNCDFELLILYVIAKFECFPAACMFTNRLDLKACQLFFEKIKSKTRLTPKALVTNCDKMYHKAWREVMGEVAHFLYNPSQMEIDWKLNLNRIVCSESEVSKFKRKWIYDSIKALQGCNESEFRETFEATIKVLKSDDDFKDFVQYFLENYDDPKTWIDFYRADINLPVNQIETATDVLRQYLNEEIEVRLDKIFHSLIRYIRDETVNSMLNSTTKRKIVDDNDNRHSLMPQKRLIVKPTGENIWNLVENETVYVVQRFLKRKCCSLVCSTCNICIHCFSCSCVDFFISNAICVHIHFVWTSIFASLEQSDSDGDEEIIIEIDEQDQLDELDILRNAIVERTSVLCANVALMQDRENLRVILDSVNQLCEVSEEKNEEHSYA